jgi:hydrogenase maturation protease
MNKKKTVLIGIGNNLLSDDGIGPFLAKTIGQKLDIPFNSITHISLDLLDLVLGHQVVYIFDSFHKSRIPAGDNVPLTLHDLEYQQNPTYSHGVTIPIIFNIGKKIYPEMPGDIRIFGINVSDNQTISESFSHELNKRLEEISNHLIKKIQYDAGGKI